MKNYKPLTVTQRQNIKAVERDLNRGEFAKGWTGVGTIRDGVRYEKYPHGWRWSHRVHPDGGKGILDPNKGLGLA